MAKQELEVSIIIPVKEINDYIRESIQHILNLDYESFEILVFPDVASNENFEKTKIIPTGPIGPAQKRDLALRYAQGEILAFLDDDAYPRKDWLKSAISYFENPEITAVCGPGVTPANDSVLQKASGWVSASFLGGGPVASYRFFPREKREVDDYPSMNFIVRKSDFKTVGGFDSEFWPGEDTHLCLNLTKRLNKKIIYDPKVLVYHHRRPLFIPHLRQNGRYGLHRGHFVHILPETSRKLSYFIPSLFTLFLFATPILTLLLSTINNQQLTINNQLSITNYYLSVFYGSTLSIYFLLLLLTAAWVFSKERNFRVALLVIPGIFLTHIWYGLRFIQGFFSKELKH